MTCLVEAQTIETAPVNGWRTVASTGKRRAWICGVRLPVRLVYWLMGLVQHVHHLKGCLR